MSIGGMYLAVINAVGFGIFGYDKWCAVHRQWRVPEKTLIAAALLGGSVGAYAGMKVFRHKTRHRYFRFGFPLLLALQSAGMLWLAVLCQ